MERTGFWLAPSSFNLFGPFEFLSQMTWKSIEIGNWKDNSCVATGSYILEEMTRKEIGASARHDLMWDIIARANANGLNTGFHDRMGGGRSDESIVEYGLTIVGNASIKSASSMDIIKALQALKISVDIDASKAIEDFVAPDI